MMTLGKQSAGIGGILTAVALGALATACSAEPGADEATSTDETVGETSAELSLPELRGAIDFARPIPTGNGRACATCHVPTDAFGLTPANVEARYRLYKRGLPDPLFKSIDANDGAQDFTNLRKGLVKVVMPLPPNVSVIGEPATREVAVWRAVPSVENVALTAPYQFDGRATTLQEQPAGAALAHSQVARIPNGYSLDDISKFELSVFSSPRAKAIARGESPSEGNLNAVEARGKAAFAQKCAQCHGGPALNTPIPPLGGRFQTIGVAEFNFANLPTKLYQIVDETGVHVQPAADPGRALVSGKAADFARFDTPSLLGVKRTAPYFHDNSAATLEDVMGFYKVSFEFARSVGVPEEFAPVITDDDVVSVSAYMRSL